MEATRQIDKEWLRPITALVGVCILLACFHTFGAAYGSGTLGPSTRFVFWFMLALLTVGQLLVFFHGSAIFLFKRLSFRYVVAAPIAFVTTTLAVALELVALKSLPGPSVSQSSFLSAALWAFPSVGLIGLLLLIWQPFRKIRMRFLKLSTEQSVAPTEAIDSGHTSTLPSVPPDWVQAQDHYLYMRRNGEYQMVRARLSDLESSFGPPIGVRVHRSWWVKLAALEQVQKTGRTWHIITKDGITIPVSRSRREALSRAMAESQAGRSDG